MLSSIIRACGDNIKAIDEIDKSQLKKLNEKIKKKFAKTQEESLNDVLIYKEYADILFLRNPHGQSVIRPSEKKIDAGTKAEKINALDDKIGFNIELKRTAIKSGESSKKEEIFNDVMKYNHNALDVNKAFELQIKHNEGKNTSRNINNFNTMNKLNIYIEKNDNSGHVNTYNFNSWGRGNCVDIKRNEYGQFVLTPSNHIVDTRIKEQSLPQTPFFDYNLNLKGQKNTSQGNQRPNNNNNNNNSNNNNKMQYHNENE